MFNYVRSLAFVVLSYATVGQSYYFEDISGLPMIKDVYEASNGDLFLGTVSGLYLRQKGQSQFQFVQVDSTIPMSINKLEYEAGNLWICSSDRGAYFYDNNNWFSLSTSNGLPSNGVNDVIEGNNGDIWLACDSGVAKYNGTVTNYSPFSSKAKVLSVGYNAGKTYASNKAPDQNMVFDGADWDTMPQWIGGTPLVNCLHDIKFDSVGQLIATYTHFIPAISHPIGICMFDGVSWSTIKSPIQNYLETLNSRIYVCNGVALAKVKGGVLDTIGLLNIEAAGLQGQKIVSFKKGIGNSFWLTGYDSQNAPFLLNYQINFEKSYEELDANGLRAGFSPADLFQKSSGVWEWYKNDRYAKFRLNGALTPSVIYSASLWMSAERNGVNCVSANTWAQKGTDWMSGPVSNKYEFDFIKKYNRVWKLDRKMVQDHIRLNGSTGYIIPEVILNWPGNGDTLKGESFLLAPFVDLNGNYIYEPHNGEYPQIKGDQAVFFMYNDLRFLNVETQGTPLGVEIHGMAYCYDTLDADLDSTIFINYSVYNRSTADLQNVKVGFWMDAELGFPHDDLAGCDSNIGVSYFYNADNNDEGYRGFGLNPPAIAVQPLSHDLRGSINYEASGSYFGRPINAMEYINYLQVRWRDTSRLYIETPSGILGAGNGDGFVLNNAGHQVTKYQYNDQVNWYESPPNLWDKRSVAIIDLGQLSKNKSTCVEFALSYARDINGGHTASLSKVKQRSQSVKAFYDQSDNGCLRTFIGVDEIIEPTFDVEIYPNPSRGLLKVEGKDISEIYLYDVLGKEVLKEYFNQSSEQVKLKLSWAKGVYYIKVVNDKGVATVSKVVME